MGAGGGDGGPCGRHRQAHPVPARALGNVAPAIRLGAIACGLAAFFLLRRSVFAGVLIGELVLVGGATLVGL